MAHEWLAAVFFHLVHAEWGVSGLILFQALLVAATAAFLALAARGAGAGTSATILSVGGGLWIAASRFWVRPHVFTWLFAAIYLAAIFRYVRAGRRLRWLLLLLPIQIFWANTHAGGSVGVLLLSLLALAEGLDGLRQGPAAALARVRLPALITLAAAGAALLNPWGAEILLFPFRLTSMSLYMERIYEWQPPWHPSYNASPMLAAWMLMMTLVLTALFASERGHAAPGTGGARRRRLDRALGAAPVILFLIFVTLRLAGTPLWGPLSAGILLACFPLLLALFAIVHRRTIEPLPVLLTLVFMILALRHNRAVADAALVGSVVLAGALSRLASRRGLHVALASALLLAASGAVVALGYPLRFGGPTRSFGLGVSRETPVCAADYVARSGISGRAFVSYAWGALFLNRAYPRVQVSIDSRNDVYGEEIYRAHLDALQSPAAMERFLEEQRVDLVALSYADPEPAVSRMLIASQAWAPLYLDDKGFVLVRRSTAPAGLVERDEYRLLRPAALGAARIDPENAAAALAEADRATAQCQESFFGWFYRAKALIVLERWQEAVETSRRATEIDPGNPTAWADLGYAWAALGDRAKAVEMYERALDLDPANAVARDNLRLLRAP